MTASWASSYADPLFAWVVLGGSAVSMLSFLAFALPLTALAWRTPSWAASWRIQSRPADVGRWFGPSLRRWASNNAILLGLLVVAWPWARPFLAFELGPWPAWYVVVGQLLLFVYLDDALYWLLHRAMHTGWLYRHVHRHHHRIVRPCAISGHDMHWLEFVLTGLLMLVGPALLGVHVGVLYLWIGFRQLEAAEGHSGLHLWFSPLSWLPGGHGADFHDAHHAKFHGNYAGILGWIDGVMGTYSDGYVPPGRRRAR